MAAFTLFGVAGFASAWMLLWGAAAVIPIVLHLINRRRQQTVSWAAMRLLLQVIEKQSKRVRIEQLILLILRTLILLTLGLALARPFFSPQVASGTVTASRPPRLWILVIDDSYSMGYREEHGTRFASAQSRAVEIVRASIQGDAFSMITMSTLSETAIYRPTFEGDIMIAAIQKLQFPDGGADLSLALSQVNDIVSDAGRNSSLPSDVHIVFLSDFGQDTWRDGLANGRSQRVLSQLATSQTVTYESFATNEPMNVALMAMTAGATRVLKDSELDVALTVANFGSVEAKQVPLQLSANGQSIESQFVDLPGGASRVVHLKLRPSMTGLMTIAATLPDDRLVADNQRQNVIEVRNEFRVLCVENPYSNPKILKAALQPPVTSQGMQVTSTSQLELSLMDLSEFDAVVLNDVTNLGESEFSRLSQFVSGGRSLVCLFGQNTDATVWNGLLGNAKNSLGFRLNEPSDVGDWRIDPLDYTSPIAAPFASYPDAGLLTTPIFRFWKIKMSDNIADRPQIELQLQDAAPLILLNRLEKGRVASLLSAPQTGATNGTSEPWNAMAAWPSFVPMMQHLVQATLSDSATPFNLNVGQSISGSQRASGDKTIVRVVRPDGTETELQSSEIDEDGLRAWNYPTTSHRGLYQVRVDDSAPRPYSVNINPTQSDLRSVPVEQLPRSTTKAQTQVAVDAASESRQPSGTLVRWLLGAMVLMLISESTLAWQLGRRLG